MTGDKIWIRNQWSKPKVVFWGLGYITKRYEFLQIGVHIGVNCMYVCMYVCMYGWMYACLCVCIYVRACGLLVYLHV